MKKALAATLVSLAAAAALAQEAPATLEQRVDQIEQKLAAESKAKDEAAKKDDEKKKRKTPVKVHGLLQIQGDTGDKGDLRFTDDNSRIYLRRVRLGATTTLLENFDVRAEMELAGSLGNATAMRAQLTDGYVNWRAGYGLAVRVGQFKTPYGYEQLIADPTMLTIERSLASDTLTLGRQLGLQVGGEHLDGRLGWTAGIFNGTPANTTTNDNGRMLVALRGTAVPVKSSIDGSDVTLKIGAAWFEKEQAGVTVPAVFGIDSTPSTPAADNLFYGRREGTGVDLSFKWGRFDAWGEMLSGKLEPDNKVPRSALLARGWAALGGYMIVADRLQLVLRREELDPDRETTGDATLTWTAGLNWYLDGHDLKLQFDAMDVSRPGVDGHEYKYLARLQAQF